MSKLTPTLPLSGASRSWPDLNIREHYDGELVSLACPIGGDKALAAHFKKAFGTSLPAPNTMIKIKGGHALWSGQGQYMLLISGEDIYADKTVAAALKDTAYTTLQSDGWASLSLNGSRVLDVLERFIPLDLRRAEDGFAARTSAHHIAVIVIKHSAAQIQLLTPRSSAHAFWESLTHTVDNTLGHI